MASLLQLCLNATPPPLRRHVTADRVALLQQFLAFGVVGVICFLVDTAFVYALRGPLGLYAAGVASYFIAATVGWALNRTFTFRGAGSASMLRQWFTFLVAGLGGLLLNRGVYFLLITVSETCVEYPVIAVAAGSVAGMFVNFAMNRRVVFR